MNVTNRAGGKLVIIGGGAAGPKTAAKARREAPEMQITLVTEVDFVSYAGCGLPYYIANVITDRRKLFARTPRQFKERQNIEVLVRHRAANIFPAKRTVEVLNVDSGKTFELEYDQLVIATGASPVVPGFPGVELRNIFTLHDTNDADRIREALEGGGVKRAVVVGAGLIGLEMVETFLARGREVRVVELLDQVLPLFDKEMADIVEKHLREKGVEVFLSDGVKGFESDDGERVARVVTAKRAIPADIVLLSIGVRPNSEIAGNAGIELGAAKAIRVNERMETSAAGIYAAGDCAEVHHIVSGKPAFIPLGSTANKQGRVAAINATGGSATFGGVVGSVVAKVCELTVGKTGLNEKEAQEAGLDYEVAIVEAEDKSHYYPGSEPMTMKLLGERRTGRVLGAQIVGKSGVDKRIDVVATTLHYRGTVSQLGSLDLCYAPPYSMAVDAILVAAEVLQKHLDNSISTISPSELKKMLEDENCGPGESCQPIVLDVRTPREYETGILEGALRIPLQELSKRVSEIEPGRPVVVYCHTGTRSYEAARILERAGFRNVKNMVGGISMWRSKTVKPKESKP
jgi:NADPH-dependent 2,4-dienoyl-CoA reductase/sulfur reductase-like enzyme/rhodanese-related sulfurtransferase